LGVVPGPSFACWPRLVWRNAGISTKRKAIGKACGFSGVRCENGSASWDALPFLFCKSRGLAGFRHALALMRVEVTLAQADRVRCHFNKLIVVDIGDGFFKA